MRGIRCSWELNVINVLLMVSGLIIVSGEVNLSGYKSDADKQKTLIRQKFSLGKH